MKSLLKEYINSIVSQLIIETIEEVIVEPKRINALGLSKLNLKSEDGINNIITVYNQASSEEKDYWGKWYHHAKDDVIELVEKYNIPFETMAAIVAVLSPGNKWKGNLLAAERVMQGSPKVNAYPISLAKANKIKDSNDVSWVSGPKVTVFYKSLLDPKSVENNLVLDGHAINIWRGEKKALKGLKKPSKETREKMVNDYLDAAKHLNVPVQAVQAVTWYIWKYTPDDIPKTTSDPTISPAPTIKNPEAETAVNVINQDKSENI